MLSSNDAGCGLSQKVRKVCLIDNHLMTRKGLALMLNETPGLKACCQAASAEEALDTLVDASPDLIILDLAIPGVDSITFIGELKKTRPQVPLLVLSDNKEKALDAIRAGVRGYITSHDTEEEILSAILDVLDGHFHISREVCDVLLAEISMGANHYPPDVLSKREMEVFMLIGRGFETSEIGVKLKVSPKTVDTYRRRIKSKLSLDNNAVLVKHAIQWVQSR